LIRVKVRTSVEFLDDDGYKTELIYEKDLINEFWLPDEIFYRLWMEFLKDPLRKRRKELEEKLEKQT
jgi:hypothetical protein